MAVCIISVLHGLYILNNYTLPGKARIVAAAFWGKTSNEMSQLETLAVEGALDNPSDGEFVSLVNMKNGKVAGIKFFISANTLYTVDRKCRQATAQEIIKALESLPEEAVEQYKGLEPVEPAPEYHINVCQKGWAGAQ